MDEVGADDKFDETGADDKFIEIDWKQAYANWARASAGGSARGPVKHKLAPGELSRTTDFWREGFGPRTKRWIQMFHDKDDRSRLERSAQDVYDLIREAQTNEIIPADWFVSVRGWMWSVKEDGYLVKLIRNDENEWSMSTRKNFQLHPPPAFL